MTATEPTVTDLEFEQDLQRDPYNFKHWWRYLEFKHDASARFRNLLHERALLSVPGSYKLWFQYLQERMMQVKDRPLDDSAYDSVNKVFERALIFMNKMPRIWVEYLRFLAQQCRVTTLRRVTDRALQSLPVTQHEMVWKVVLGFVKQDWVPVDTTRRLWRRYLQLEPHQVEDFVIYLRKHRKWNDIINVMIRALNDSKFVSVKGKTRHELWVDLCAMISRQGPTLKLEDKSMTVENIIRSGISKFPNEVGQLWCALADYCTRCGHFDRARDVYETGITTVTTVKDFSQVFDAYAQFEESLLTSKMEQASGNDEEEENQEDPYTKAYLRVAGVDFTLGDEVDYRLERLTALVGRRPALLNSVLLRQNPHNVYEWHNRVKIFKGKAEKVVQTFTEAVKTVDPGKAVGRPHTLWTSFAKWYESKGDVRSARKILEHAVQQEFKSIDDLANVWTEYAELELRHKKYRKALELLRRATATNFAGVGNWKTTSGPVKERLWRSVKLWSFYADLTESLCTIKSAQNVYERMIYLKVATPHVILNYARMMQESDYWEESFRAYEQGVALFKWPLVHPIWTAYLKAFVGRFKGRKVERARDLFERACKDVPPETAAQIFLMHARYEDRHGLARECLKVYDTACDRVPPAEKPGMFRRYIAATRKFFGVTRTREVYEKALRKLPDNHVPQLGVEWADVERSLGEIDRCRAIYMHCAQYVDPRKENTFWPKWHQFEVPHGNEQSFREMLRIRRSVQATFSTSINLGAASEQAKMERQILRDEEEVQAKANTGEETTAAAPQDGGRVAVNPDAEPVQFVSIEELARQQVGETEAEKAAEEDYDIQQQPVPQAVYDGVQPAAKRARVG
eukprot:TRINITY_DN32378_c0_g1_i1.p1 TRINITY_DN32378_c0_g1~~TRINITY_DN32378_c0_g1_i1.p1  ORF type:complete len:856 (+),score=325.96 TRINITY_DN32378_c0_g1_i1:79-2646(+)